jgi:hypothetical protein
MTRLWKIVKKKCKISTKLTGGRRTSDVRRMGDMLIAWNIKGQNNILWYFLSFF